MKARGPARVSHLNTHGAVWIRIYTNFQNY